MMKLINGKFYVDGKEVPVEIGNRQQIALIQERQKLMEEGAKIDIDMEEVTTYTIAATFKCPSCGRHNLIDDDSEYHFDNSDIKDLLELESTCYGCGQDFELIEKDGHYKYKAI